MKLSHGLLGIIGAGLLGGCATTQQNSLDDLSRYVKLMAEYATEESQGERVVGDLFIDLTIDEGVVVTKKKGEGSTEYFTLSTKYDLLDLNDPFKMLAVSYLDSSSNGFDRKDTVYMAVETENYGGVESFVFLDSNADGKLDGIHLSDKPLIAYCDSFDSLEFGSTIPEMDDLYQKAAMHFVND